MTRRLILPLVAAGVALAGCSSSGTPSVPAPGTSAALAASSTTVTVFAAASLKVPFTILMPHFEAAYPGVTLRFSFGGSSDLVAQLASGAPVDVLATADERTMGKAKESGRLVSEPQIFATNTLTIAVPKGNPAKVTGLKDLSRPGVKLVVCAPQVPCGAVTKKLAEKTNTTFSPVSEESSVTDVLGKVRSGQADAGLVYHSDASTAAKDVDEVALPEAASLVNRYPIALVGKSPEAKAFIDLVRGPLGREALSGAGLTVL